MLAFDVELDPTQTHRARNPSGIADDKRMIRHILGHDRSRTNERISPMVIQHSMVELAPSVAPRCPQSRKHPRVAGEVQSGWDQNLWMRVNQGFARVQAKSVDR